MRLGKTRGPSRWPSPPACWASPGGGVRAAGGAGKPPFPPPLDEAQRMETLQLVALDARLEAEVEVGQGLHGREPGGAHGGLEPALIAERDVAPQERAHRLAGGELAAGEA